MKYFIIRFFTIIFFLSSFEVQGIADFFVSLKSSEVNMRVGPGKEYPISWIFMRANLPMQLIAEFDQWRKVKFIDGTVGWVHKNMISRKNSAIVIDNNAIMYRHASTKYPIAKVEKYVIVKVIKKDDNWVKVSINNQKGWIDKKNLWGVNED
ncbi:MAG: hypothetical protein IJ730_03220 [Alphaproteobacteria bacterium]|nr:hypothetical protein [Alphaproteobacteria bacterium]